MTLATALLVVNLCAAPECTIFRRATIIDGTGQPSWVGDIAIRGDRIVSVAPVVNIAGAKVIDVKGWVIAPGFIDLHTHSDLPLQADATRANLSYAWQGVTTVVTGNCGSGPVDVAAYYRKLEEKGIGGNVAHQVPHNAVRSKVMGNVNRGPTTWELSQMADLVDQGMRDGAWGLSTGLIYNPGTYSKTDELIALAKPAAKHSGFYASHIRDEGAGLLDSIGEAIRIGKEAGLPVHISHIKCTGRKNWGKSGDAIAIIEQARASGLRVTADQYPYTASSTSLRAMVVPARFREGSAEEFRKRLDDPDAGPKLKAAVEQAIEGRSGGATLRIASYKANKKWQGKNLVEIAEVEKRPIVDIVLEIERNGGAQVVSFGMSEEDLRMYIKRPWVATASDGSSKVPNDTVPHPRSYGTFPRKIGHYGVQEKVIPLEQAVRSSSGLPADILKMPERGYLKAGYFADIVVFDPKSIIDKATFDQPHQYAEGTKWVLVNGVAVIEDGKATMKLPGRALRHVAP